MKMIKNMVKKIKSIPAEIKRIPGRIKSIPGKIRNLPAKIKSSFTREKIFSKETLRKFMLLVCIVVFIYSSSTIIIKFYKDADTKGYYDDLEQTPIPTNNYSPVLEENPETFDLVDISDGFKALSLYPQITDYPVGDSFSPNGKAIGVFHDKAMKVNRDVVGYINIPDTNINYPVLQNLNDNDYYLDRDIRRTITDAASIFLDFRNRIYAEDRNTIIYGHNMKNKEMFAHLHLYDSWSFARDHRIITYNTLYEDMEWEIFASFETHVSFNYIKTTFSNDAEFLELIDTSIKRSNHDYGIRPTANDRILTLSTCARNRGRLDADDYRYVVMAVLVKRTPK